MTVKELIEKLSKCDQYAEVMIRNPYNRILTKCREHPRETTSRPNEDKIVIIGEYFE